jgi:hypothetical protein
MLQLLPQPLTLQQLVPQPLMLQRPLPHPRHLDPQHLEQPRMVPQQPVQQPQTQCPVLMEVAQLTVLRQLTHQLPQLLQLDPPPVQIL